MKCLICLQADIVDGITSVIFDRGEFHLVVNNVPARVCPGCGEAYVTEVVAAHLLESAEAVSFQGVMDDVIEY